MIALPPGARVWLAAGTTDMRRGFDGLGRQVQEVLQLDPFSENGIKAIMFFSQAEQGRAEGILDKLGLLGHRDIILIDARADNKPSGSKA